MSGSTIFTKFILMDCRNKNKNCEVILHTRGGRSVSSDVAVRFLRFVEIRFSTKPSRRACNKNNKPRQINRTYSIWFVGLLSKPKKVRTCSAMPQAEVLQAA